MAAFNSFRTMLVFAAGLIVWFSFFSERTTFARYRRSPVQTVATLPSSCNNDGQFVITFDEGPSQVTGAVLDGLDAANAKATFHVVTEYLSQTIVMTDLKDAYSRGHIIGLRFPTDQNPSTMSDVDLKTALMDGSALIYNEINVYPKFLRLPDGQYTDHTVQVANELGFVVTTWNIDTFDYENTVTKDSILNQYATAVAPFTQGKGSFIALERDLYSIWDDQSILPAIVQNMSAHGYASVNLDVCLGESSAYRANNNDPDGQVATPGTVSTKSSAFRPELSILSITLSLIFLL